MPDGSATAHTYRPKLATVLAEGYSLAHFRRDMLAALTVAIVALPLSMAIAVASGVSPERGLYAAVIGGFLVSALGGSRFQIGGPAGAFIVLVSATVKQIRPRRAVAHGFPLRLHADADRPAAARLADPLHPACGDRRLHLRDRGHDLRQPDQGSRRPETAGCRTRAVIAKACRAWPGAADHQPGRARNWCRLGGIDLPAAALAAELAGHADRRGAGLAGGMAVPFAGRDHRQPFWPTPGWPAGTAIAVDLVFIACSRCCRPRSPSRCWARSKACCRRRWPTA